jgi:hypothetical protein
MITCTVPIKSIDRARDLFYKENPQYVYDKFSLKFQLYIREKYGIQSIFYDYEGKHVDFDRYRITFSTEVAVTFFILSFS